MNPRPFLFAAMLAAVSAPAAEPVTIRLWSGRAPGETKEFPPEANITTDKDNRPAGRPVVRLSPVAEPTLTVFSPDPARNNGTAVVICPGGAYARLAIDLEGYEPAAWLNSLGVTAAVLKYRVPVREGLPRHFAPAQDAQRALGILRSRAAEFGIDPRRIGMLGFSAGAHLAAVLSNLPGERLHPAVDEADRAEARPAFVALIYPGYLRAQSGGVAPEVTPQAGRTPPTFLAMTQDDPVQVENAVSYYLALKQAGVPAEMHLFPGGGHGYGMRRTEAPGTTWPARMEDWMRAAGWLERAK